MIESSYIEPRLILTTIRIKTRDALSIYMRSKRHMHKLMTSSYFSYDLSLRHSWIYCTSAHGKSSVYLGKLSEQVQLWLLTFLRLPVYR